MNDVPVPDRAAFSRQFTCDLEVRAAGGERILAGIVVPYERTARVSDGGPSYDEMFRMGAFAKTLERGAGAVKFLSQHNGRVNPLGRGEMFREDSAGLYGELKVSKTVAGDEALELARDGALDSFSVGFTPVKHIKQGQVVVRTEVHLREVSLVTFPAYEDARVLAVRELAADAGLDPEEAIELMRLLPTLRTVTPQEPTVQGTSTDAAPQDAPATGHASRIAWTNFRASLIEKGII